jgi:hypothetical protein
LEPFAALGVGFVASICYDDETLAIHCLDIDFIAIAGVARRRGRDWVLSVAATVTVTHDVHTDALLLDHCK